MQVVIWSMSNVVTAAPLDLHGQHVQHMVELSGSVQFVMHGSNRKWPTAWQIMLHAFNDTVAGHMHMRS